MNPRRSEAMGMFDAPRCQHVKTNGTQCDSPALSGGKLCFFHRRARQQRLRMETEVQDPQPFVLPLLEDANSIQMALMQIMQLMISGRMDRKMASTLLYSLQIASSNLARVNLNPWAQDVVTHPRQLGRTPLMGHVWEKSCEVKAEGRKEEFEEAEAGAREPRVSEGPTEVWEDALTEPEPGQVSAEDVRKRIRELVVNALPQIMVALEKKGEVQFRLEPPGGKSNGRS
jgi:hypothetical protein